MVSALTLIVFAILAAGSGDIAELMDFEFDRSFEYIDENNVKTAISLRGSKIIITEGQVNKHGSWYGYVTEEYYSLRTGKLYSDYKFHSYNGKKCGWVTRSYYNSSGQTTYNNRVYYINGRRNYWQSRYSQSKSALSGESAYDLFSGYYPEDVLILSLVGYDSIYQEKFLDSLELVLNSMTFEAEDFDDYYKDALEALETSPYDSIISDNEALSFLNGFELIKNHPFRLGVVDRFLEERESSIDVMQTRYPGFITDLEEAEISEYDFLEFCRQFDSCMFSYGALDLQDPFLLDSIDSRIFRAIMSLYEKGGDDSKAALKSLSIPTMAAQMGFGDLLSEVKSEMKVRIVSTDTPEVAEVILYTIFMSFLEGDLIKQSVREAYMRSNEIIELPTVGTGEVLNISVSSVSLGGFVFYDGASDILGKGVVWGETYDPTVEMNSLSSSVEGDSFNLVIAGLEDGKEYYARAFATNSQGTAYGSTVSFIATEVSDVEENDIVEKGLQIYPNPASEVAYLKFSLETQEFVSLTLINLKGQVVYYDIPGLLAAGENVLELDLNGIATGVYFCNLSGNGSVLYTQKLVRMY